MKRKMSSLLLAGACAIIGTSTLGSDACQCDPDSIWTTRPVVFATNDDPLIEPGHNKHLVIDMIYFAAGDCVIVPSEVSGTPTRTFVDERTHMEYVGFVLSDQHVVGLDDLYAYARDICWPTEEVS